MQQAGMNKKGNTDTIIYIVIIVIIGVFVFNMKNIYNFTSGLRNPKPSNPPTPEVEEPDTSKPQEEEDKYTIVKPIGENQMVCEYTETSDIPSQDGGNITTGSKKISVYLYNTDSKLKSINEKVAYEGIDSDYTNYIYSERKKYENIKDANLKLEGFSIETELSGTLSLSTSLVVDLEKVKLADIDFDGVNSIIILGEYDQNITDVVTQYEMKGYVCKDGGE